MERPYSLYGIINYTFTMPKLLEIVEIIHFRILETKKCLNLQLLSVCSSISHILYKPIVIKFSIKSNNNIMKTQIFYRGHWRSNKVTFMFEGILECLNYLLSILNMLSPPTARKGALIPFKSEIRDKSSQIKTRDKW